MRLKFNGVKYKYKPKYYKREDELNIEYPKYSSNCYGLVFHDGEWRECRFWVFKEKGKMTIDVSPVGIVQDKISSIGPTNDQGNVARLQANRFQRFLINTYDRIFFAIIRLLMFRDKLIPIKKNLIYMSLALIGASAYFLINHFFDNYLQRLVNESNFIQSLIVFLSLSSIINIFHPFTLRKEIKMEQVDELVNKKTKRAKEEYEHEQYVKNMTTL